MTAPPHLIERALRRSAVRTRILHIVARRGRVHASHLARIAQIDAKRLRWAMRGHRPRRGAVKYRPDSSLVRLGLLVEERTERRLTYRATPRGRAWARKLAKRRDAQAWL